MPLLFLAPIEVIGPFAGLTVLRANSEEDCITSALLCSALLCAGVRHPMPWSICLKGVDVRASM